MLTAVVLLSILFANILGVVLHYTHKRYTKSFLLHILSAVNESTWEHLKLAFIPMLFLSFVQYFILKEEYSNVLEANLYSILLTLLLIPLIYYPTRFFLKREVFWISILIFILSIVLGYTLEYLLLENRVVYLGEPLSFVSLVVLFFLFTVFTFFPPRIFLFKDPVNNTYGHIKQ